MNSSLDGLTTIRAFNAEQTFKDDFDKHQDLYTSASLSLKISMTAFGFFMDMTSAMLTTAVVARIILSEQSKYRNHFHISHSSFYLITSNLLYFRIEEIAYRTHFLIRAIIFSIKLRSCYKLYRKVSFDPTKVSLVS